MKNLLVFLFVCTVNIEAYTFICLVGCQCDTNEEIIHCDDNLIRKTVPLPPHGTHLRGFTVLSLTNNNIDQLPDEPLLLAKFPDLKTIDLEGNKNFDCDTLKLFSNKLNVLSNCGGGKKSGGGGRIRVHGRHRANSAGDTENDHHKNGETSRHKTTTTNNNGRRRHQSGEDDSTYVGCLWDQLHERLNDITEDYGLTSLVDDIGKMFNDVGDRIKKITTA